MWEWPCHLTRWCCERREEGEVPGRRPECWKPGECLAGESMTFLTWDAPLYAPLGRERWPQTGSEGGG